MSHSTPISRRWRTAGIAAAAGLVLVVGIPAAATAATAEQTSAAAKPAKPTIVIVHGAWADGSSFAPVTEELQHDGYKVLVAPNPLRGLASDAANVAAFVNQATTGDVILVGHSYGGAVITNSALQSPTVKGLVYVDAFAPDAGESVLQLVAAQPGSALAVADPSTVLNFVQYPGATGGDVDTYVKPELFGKIFGADLKSKDRDVLAAGQSPVTLSALQATTTNPAWKSLKSYFFVGTNDKVIPPAEQLAMAKRANATVVQGKADHLSMLETPKPIVKLIETAASAVK